ncbi:SGNH/GDSL hydrolase family protein [Jannaschia sp. S6380]|uniref:SGNH/GDSL hydrolase family protein n=1 Tax=Jannaschia sp. S6380 TaxID=2926408 RepID=UPI001FF33802|nr:SGNH/GDSL hydrolase family protein [Jannaschia sp. S6380]MCK0167876.1 SGNH/GDSL hydrolase family protein [Jannaschia sp. S6380]
MRPFILLPLILTACAAAGPRSDDAILAIGDSVMAWNGARGIPEALEAAIDRPVTDASQSLAQLTNPNDLAGLAGFDISEQFRGDGWDWVVITGGGNDIRDACRTPAEAQVLDTIISPDLDGDLPDLIARIRATGANAAFVGYYDGAAAEPTGFTPCQPAFDRMNARLARLAARDPGFLFLDAGDVIDPRDTGLYAPDLVHPSPRGSALIGTALARAIRAVEAGG